MFRQLFKTGGTLCATVVVPDKMSRSERLTKVKNIFFVDEYGSVTRELVTITQTAVFSMLAGACYGGFMHSREAYLRFIERNDATKFTDHYEAKKKLQDTVTINFAKGALKWGWRVGLFGGVYVTFVTALCVYRGEPKIRDYVGAGLIAGGVYRLNYGLNGLIVGSILGATLGLFAGTMSIALLKLTGSNYDDVYKYQSEPYLIRQKHLAQAVHKNYTEDVDTSLLSVHDQRKTVDQSKSKLNENI